MTNISEFYLGIDGKVMTERDDGTIESLFLSEVVTVKRDNAGNIIGMKAPNGQDIVGGGGSSLPVAPFEKAVLQYKNGIPSWVASDNVVSDSLSRLSFTPTTVPSSVNSLADQYITGNVLTGATTLTGTLRIVNYKVVTVGSPGGVTYSAGVTSTTNPLGTFVLNIDGSYALNPRLYTFGLQPAIVYTVTNGLSTQTGTLVFNLSFVNHAPIVNPDTVTMTQNTSVTINALANDLEPDGQGLVLTQINSVPVIAGGAAVQVTNATVALAANGFNLVITPTTGFTGIITFPYTVSDNNSGGTLSSTGIVTVTVNNAISLATSNYIIDVNTVVPFNFAANPLAKNATVYEPTTGATIKRITDVTQDFPGRAALYNAYSRYPTENVSGEYCLAFADNSTSCLVIDRASGGVVASLAYDNSGLATHTIGAVHEIRWHYTSAHPYRVYFVRGTQFWMIDDVRNQNATRTMIKDFATVIDWSTTPNNSRVIYMDQEGNSSLDSDHWAWMAAYYDGTTFKVRAFVHYQVSNDKVDTLYPADLAGFARTPGGESTLTTFRTRPNMVEMAPDASGIVIHHQRAYPGSSDAYIGTLFEAPYLWPIDFKPTTLTPFRISADATHSGWSSVNGAWYFVNQDNRRDKWCAVPISGIGKGFGNEGFLDVTQNLNSSVIDFHTDGGFYPGMHFALCTNAADGWTLVSTYTTQSADTYGLGNALYMMKIVPEAQTIKWHVAPTCNQYPAAQKQDYNEAPGSINLAGTRVYTCGDYNGTLALTSDGISRYVDLFSIDLPNNWRDHFTLTPPTNITLSSITGTATQGQTLNYVAGVYSGFPNPAISHVFQRGTTDIIGATGSSYTLTPADVGSQIRIKETATNSSGSITTFSAYTATVVGLAVPVNTVAPSISGNISEGSLLTGSVGTWTNNPTSFSRQWLRNGVAISGATSTTYVLVSADVGTSITFRVIATNSFGDSLPAASDPVGPITAFQGIISRVNAVASTDPSPGSNVLARSTPAFDTFLGNLIVVSVDWDTNLNTNTSVSVSDTAGNTYTAGTAVARIGLQGMTQQFYTLSSLAKTGNIVTVTNTASSTPLNASVVQYTASSGSTWQRIQEITFGTDYVPNPVVTPAFNMPANSVAVAHYSDLYGVAGTVVSSDTVVHVVAGNTWTLEKIRGNAATGVTFSSQDSGHDYTRTAVAVSIFSRT